jgi:hypothetical protein
VPPELWAGLLCLAVCAGAVLGPRLYRAIVVGRLVRALGDEFTATDYPAARELMSLGWPEAEAGLRGFAERTPRTAFLPGLRAVAAAPRGLEFRLGLPPQKPQAFIGARQLVCLHDGGSFEQYLVGAEILALGPAPAGDGLAVDFALDDPVAAKLGRPAGERYRAVLGIDALRRAAYGGSRVQADYGIKTEETIWRQVLEGLAPLLRGAGLAGG